MKQYHTYGGLTLSVELYDLLDDYPVDNETYLSDEDKVRIKKELYTYLNPWAWTGIIVTAEYRGRRASYPLGPCSYTHEGAFWEDIETVKGAYDELRQAILSDLAEAAEAYNDLSYTPWSRP